MPTEALRSLLYHLLSHVPEDTSPRVMVVKPDVPAPTPIRPSNGQKNRAAPPKAAYDPQLVFVLELSTILALRDSETIDALAKDVAEPLGSVVRNAENTHPSVVSRAVYYLLSVLRASATAHDFIRAPLILHTLSSFPQPLLESSALPLLRGLSDCVGAPGTLRSEVASSPDFWQILSRLAPVPEASAAVFEVVEELAVDDEYKKGGVTADNYQHLVALLSDFATAGQAGAQEEQRRETGNRDGKRPGKGDEQSKASERKRRKNKTEEVVNRGVRAVGLVYGLMGRVTGWIEFSHLERRKGRPPCFHCRSTWLINITAWTTYWSPIFKTLSTQSLNPCRPIRSTALTSLQRCLLSPTLTSIPLNPNREGAEYAVVFNDVLFPLISQLLKPEVYQTDPSGMGETRVQTAGLMGRVFLHFLEKVGPDYDASLSTVRPPSSTGGADNSRRDSSQHRQEDSKTLFSIWTRILSVLERLMTSSGPSSGNNVEEAIPESLKNILLVMSSDGYLVPPEADESKRQVWNETWRRLDRFLPGLLGELFPQEVEQGRGKPWLEKKGSRASGDGKGKAADKKEEVKEEKESQTNEDDVD